MILYLDWELTLNDKEDLEENFSNSFNEEEKTIDTKDSMEDFDDWLQNYINIWYSILWNKDEERYELTDISDI